MILRVLRLTFIPISLTSFEIDVLHLSHIRLCFSVGQLTPSRVRRSLRRSICCPACALILRWLRYCHPSIVRDSNTPQLHRRWRSAYFQVWPPSLLHAIHVVAVLPNGSELIKYSDPFHQTQPPLPVHSPSDPFLGEQIIALHWPLER